MDYINRAPALTPRRTAKAARRFGHWALGIGHWALGIGHWALGIEDMNKPKIGEVYIFVRATSNGFEHTELVCYRDSAGFASNGKYHVFEFTKDPAVDAVSALSQLGFTELNEGKSVGLVPESWSPTPETFVLKPSVVVAQKTVPTDASASGNASEPLRWAATERPS